MAPSHLDGQRRLLAHGVGLEQRCRYFGIVWPQPVHPLADVYVGDQVMHLIIDFRQHPEHGLRVRPPALRQRGQQVARLCPAFLVHQPLGLLKRVYGARPKHGNRPM